MEKRKSFLIKSLVLSINAALVLGGVFFIKNNQEQTQAAAGLATSADPSQNVDQTMDAGVAANNTAPAGNQTSATKNTTAIPAPKTSHKTTKKS